MHRITPQDRFRGCLLGLATGDALGTTLEFRCPRHLPSHRGHDRRRAVRAPPRPVGPTTRRWRCAWPRASSNRADSTRSTRCAATCAGGTRATCPRRGSASTSATPCRTRSPVSTPRTTPTPARPNRGRRATDRSCGSPRCPCSSPPTPRRRWRGAPIAPARPTRRKRPWTRAATSAAFWSAL